MPSVCFVLLKEISEASQLQRKDHYLAHSKAQVVVRDDLAVSSPGGYQWLEWCRKKGHRVSEKAQRLGFDLLLITYSPRSPAKTHLLNIVSTVT